MTAAVGAPARASTARESWVLTTGAAVVVAVEFIVIGLGPAMAQDMALTPQQTGWFVTCFALGSTVMGSVAAIVMRGVGSDRAMILALLPFAANLSVPLLRDPAYLYALRFLQGATLPLFIVVASDTLARVTDSDTSAVARIYLGVTRGGLFGVPAGAAIADRFGWATPMVLLGALAAAVALAITRLPRLRIAVRDSPTGEIMTMLRPGVLLHLALSFVQFAAMFCTYAFLGTILLRSGSGGNAMAISLLGFGLAGMAGNALAGYAAGRSVRAAAIGVAVMIAVPALALHGMPLSPVALPLLLAIWGAAHAAAFVICQIRVSRAAPRAPRLAAALNISAANLGIATGSAAGGWALASGGFAALGWAGLGFSLTALTLALVTAIKPMPGAG
ncbi:DHA1 family inner membrane transport protein [Sphingomonas sp. UYAg733]